MSDLPPELTPQAHADECERIDGVTQMSQEINAMDVLLGSEWWTKECENANLHSMYGSYSILEEFRNLRVEERDAV